MMPRVKSYSIGMLNQSSTSATQTMVGRAISAIGTRVLKLGEKGARTKLAVAILVDFVASFSAIVVSHYLRLSSFSVEQLWLALLVVPLATVLIFRITGVYRIVVRFSGIQEMTPLFRGVVLSSLGLLVVLFLLAPQPNPRSIFIIYGLLLILFTVAPRHLWVGFATTTRVSAGVPIAIYGAGALGRQVMQICRNGVEYQPVFWLDDNKKLQGRNLAQAKVLDPKDSSTPRILKEHGVETILMAIPSVGVGRMKQLLESLQAFNCSVKTLPSISDIMANRVTSRDAKSLPLEEIIGRQPVEPVPELMCKNITGKVVMVTGAGGSVGSELCRQIIRLKPSALVLLDISEAALYQIEQNLLTLVDSDETEGAAECKHVPMHCVLGNVILKENIAFTIAKHGVQTLFHAAAYKHVPLVESNPQAAIKTNILGTLATVEAAMENGVENFLLISTDKAVRPTNVMGATKRVAEMVVQARSAQIDSGTCLSIVRFGNVIGSSGSVVPKFSEQIESGGPVTVTHEKIVRFFMSIPEAAQLVIQASALARGGDLFLLDMGQPVQIADLAKSLVYLHGKTLKDDVNPNGEIEILYPGLREGEKLFEELLIDDTAEATRHPKISRARESYIGWSELRGIIRQLELSMDSNPDDQMISQLKAVVVGYQPNRSTALKTPSRGLVENSQVHAASEIED